MSDLVHLPQGNRAVLWQLLNKTLDEQIALPDEDAATALQGRLCAWSQVDKLHDRGYSERGIIALEFDKRRLWSFIDDPLSGAPFHSWSAWVHSGALGGSGDVFRAKGDVEMLLPDVPAEDIVDISRSNLQVLKGVSTAVRKAVCDAAKELTSDALIAKIAKEYPNQHVEARKMLRFSLERSAAEEVESVIKEMIDQGIAGTKEEAIGYAFQCAREYLQTQRETV